MYEGWYNNCNMSAPEFDPLDRIVNGERATDIELAVLEQTATDLLERSPVVVTRGYNYFGNDDAALLLRTYHDGNSRSGESKVELALCRTDDFRLKLLVTFNHTNELNHLRFNDESGGDTLGEAHTIANNLLVSDFVSEEGKDIAKQLLSYIETTAMMGELETLIGMAERDRDGANTVHIADLTRLIISFHSTLEVRRRKFEHRVDDTHKLRVIEQVVAGDLSSADISKFPVFQIFYGSHKEEEGSRYTRNFDGSRLGQHITPDMRHESERGEFPDDAEEETSSWGFDIPRRDMVEMLMEELAKASSLRGSSKTFVD